MTRQMRIGGRVLGVALALMLAAALAAPARATEAEVKAALDLMPADAPMVLVVPNPARLNKKIAGLGETLGIQAPQMADVLGEFKKASGFLKGTRDDGPVAVAFTDAKALNDAIAGNGAGEPPMLIAVPMKDYKDLVENFGGKADDETPELQTPSGQTMYAHKHGEFALLSNVKEVAAGYKQPGDAAKWIKMAGKACGRHLGSSDAVLIINVASMSEALNEKIKEGLQMVQQGMQMAPPGADPASMAMAKTMIGIYADAASALVRDASVLVIAVDMTDKGIGLTMGVQFKADSSLAKTFAKGGGAAEALLRLPDAPYLMAMSMNTRGVDFKSLTGDLVAKLNKDNPNDALTQIMSQSFDNLTRVKSMAMAVYAPQGGANVANLINVVNVIETTDAAAYIKSNKELLEKLPKLKIGAGNGGAPDDAPADKPAAPGYTTKYTEKALQIDGTDVDQYQVSMTLPPEALQGPVGPIIQAMGLTNQTGYICVSGNYVVNTVSPDVALIKQALAAVKAGSGLGAGSLIKTARTDGLPVDPAMEMYINPVGVASVANQFLAMFGGAQIKLPANVPPIAAGVAVEEGGMVNRLYVPIPVIAAIKDAVDKFTPPGGGPRRRPGPRGGDNGPPPPPQ